MTAILALAFRDVVQDRLSRPLLTLAAAPPLPPCRQNGAGVGGLVAGIGVLEDGVGRAMFAGNVTVYNEHFGGMRVLYLRRYVEGDLGFGGI